MNGHLTDQQLIDYQFDLASEADSGEARTHLEKCETCRRRLHALARKLGALELLRDDVTASKTLLSETLRNATQAGRWKVLLLHRLPWAGAVAAAVVVGIGLLSVPSVLRKEQSRRPSSPVVVQQETVPPKALVAAGKGEAKGPAHSMPVRGYEQTPSDVATSVLVAAAPTAQAGTAIDERPPFAPASAIELVVLPRRDTHSSSTPTIIPARRSKMPALRRWVSFASNTWGCSQTSSQNRMAPSQSGS